MDKILHDSVHLHSVCTIDTAGHGTVSETEVEQNECNFICIFHTNFNVILKKIIISIQFVPLYYNLYLVLIKIFIFLFDDKLLLIIIFIHINMELVPW